MAKFQHWIAAMRPKTLPAAVVPVWAASGLAAAFDALALIPALLCLAFALLMQVGTNFANDYLDFERGTDGLDRMGPQRAVASGWISVQAMRFATVGVLGLGFVVGLSLLYFGSWWLLLVGLSSIACAYLYTGGPRPLAYNGLGDCFVVLFFGFIAVGATFYVQTGMFNLDALLLGLALGLVINNLLLVNNYRDVEGDRLSHKRTLVVLFGRSYARFQYLFCLLVPAVAVCALSARLGYPWLLLAILPLFGGLALVRLLVAAEDAAAFGKVLAGSAGVVVVFGGTLGGLLFLA